MTEGEKMVWAAAYAAGWIVETHNPHRRKPVQVSTCIENAWAAVVEMREAKQAMVDGWGADDDATKMHQEMLT